EEEINDRLSFKYFLGLPPEEPAPDETTLVKFRKILAEQDLIQPLFEKLESQCQKWGP
ncbi:MAG: IS5/IS1182 family transposase, partial [Thermodesulfatator sp.]